jgi:glycosyltransferase involved in cell wall biosynthesis
MKWRVSCMMTVCNEEKYLPYSLPVLTCNVFDELVVVLDRCTDSSEQLIREYADARIVTKHVMLGEHPLAEAKAYGCAQAYGRYVMVTDADIILDVGAVAEASQLLDAKPDVNIVCFTYRNYSLFGGVFSRVKDEWINLFGKVVRHLKLQPLRTGIYLMRRDLQIPQCESEYDYLQQIYATVAIETDTLHLRPQFGSKKKQLLSGAARARLPQYNLAKMLLASILQLQPYLLVGYLYRRWNR